MRYAALCRGTEGVRTQPPPPPLEYPNLFIQFTVNVPKTGLGPFDKYTCNYLTYAPTPLPPPPVKNFLIPAQGCFVSSLVLENKTRT